MMKPAVEVTGLEYAYPSGQKALDEVSLTVEEGEVVAVLGPNGAGKSTLMLHLAGALKGGGKVKIFGVDVREKNRRELIQEIGVVFQHPDDQLFMPSVFDDVAFGPLNMGLSKEEVKLRVKKALTAVGLAGFEYRLSHSLSFGEKKKAALATVLSMQPKIILLDEPTANLDPRSKRELVALIKKLKNEGKTIIFSTHDVSAVPEVADRVYVLNKKIVAEGTPREVFSDVGLLKNMNLEVPAVTYLFKLLSCFGYDTTDLPMSTDEAIEHLTKTAESGGGHLHLHIHEHTHEKIKKLGEEHGHH